MKRSALKRTTPLARGGRLKRVKLRPVSQAKISQPESLQRRRLKRISKKQAALKLVDDATRLRILARDDFRCRKCKRKPNGTYWLEVHHVHTRRIPSTRHEDSNLVTLCKSLGGGCHQDAHDHGKEFRAWWEKELADSEKRQGRSEPAGDRAVVASDRVLGREPAPRR